MNRLIRLFAIVAAFAAPSAHALTLTVSPGSLTVPFGGQVTFNVDASGLGATDVSIGTFDIDIQFDAGVLAFDSATFGTGLDVLLLGSLQETNASVPGVVNFFEVSFDSIADLNTLQLDAFTLFTLTFNAIGAGTSGVQLSPNVIGDAFGNALDVDAIANSDVTVAAVPLPAAVWLLLSGVGVLVGAGRRRVS